jgi:hydrogenase/urease accessory protein HupE
MKFLLVMIAVLTAVASAHEVRPAFLELKECAPGEFDVLWKVPALGGTPLVGEEIAHTQSAVADGGSKETMPCGCPVPSAAELSRGVLAIHPSLPEKSRVVVPVRVERIPGAEIKRWTISTDGQGLEGWNVAIHGLQATMIDTLVRIELADGRVISRLLRPDSPSFVFGSETAGQSVRGYLMLGVEHILMGIDHLLFVLALMLIVRGSGMLVKTITAFTVAHSITLTLATLGHVSLPAAPVEAVIALSIVFVATEIIRSKRGQTGLTERSPWLVAFIFGLLHGFGFAGALGELGLPPNDVPLALLLFNIGVEAGQLAFVVVVLALCAPLRRMSHNPPRWSAFIPPYAIGGVAMVWVVQRISSL